MQAPDDRQWFEREVVRVLPDLYGTALRLTTNSADAEDLAAEAVAKGWMRLETLHERASFRGWIFRILSNTFISERRARAVRPALEPLGDESEAAGFSIFERLHQPFLLWWGTPEQAFLDKVLHEDLERAIDALPDVYRVAVIMADLQGLSYDAIAETLGVPIGTVRSRLARGRSLLQKRLWDHAVDAGLVAPNEERQEEPQ
ncbi:MAG: sigma-70 family RNA polymerase sigma factor [Gemmatimonadaceae bacterium]